MPSAESALPTSELTSQDLARERSQIDLPLPLAPWVRPLTEAEGLGLVDLQAVNLAEEIWNARAEEVLKAADASQRQFVIRSVSRTFLWFERGVLQETPLLALMRGGHDKLRRDLFHANHALANLWPLLACRQVVVPQLERHGEGVLVASEHWDAFVERFIAPDTTDANKKKTKTSVISCLQSLGVLAKEGNAAAPTRLRHGKPHVLAIAWAIGEQLALELRSVADLQWCLRLSEAATLFALRPEQVKEGIDIGLAVGMLHQVELVGGRVGIACGPTFGLRSFVPAVD
jgi:hypothetical protein